MTTSDARYTIISADCHAGGSHEMYRDYLAAEYWDQFDAWRASFKNPFADLEGPDVDRNWDSAARQRDLHADGVVGEVVFPNTIPPFHPSGQSRARPPSAEDYELRLAGIRAHNRWMADFCNMPGVNRAGTAKIMLLDVEEAVRDIRWASQAGLRGGIVISAVPPGSNHARPLYDPIYEKVWAVCEELGLPVNTHEGNGLPDYADLPVADALHAAESVFYSQRPFVHLLLAGVFERHPRLQFVMSEIGCSWLPKLLMDLDWVVKRTTSGSLGSIRFDAACRLPNLASDYFYANCWIGLSQPSLRDVEAVKLLGTSRFMWGNDYPHSEGTWPYSEQHLRQLFSDFAPDKLQDLLANNAARVYGFDLGESATQAATFGPLIADVATGLDCLPAEPLEAFLKVEHEQRYPEEFHLRSHR